jgi:hypothetical protein
MDEHSAEASSVASLAAASASGSLDVVKLAFASGCRGVALDDSSGWDALKRYTALVLEEAALYVENANRAPDQWECAEIIRALKP